MTQPEKPGANAPTWNTRRIIMVVLLIPIVVLFFYNWIASTSEQDRAAQRQQLPVAGYPGMPARPTTFNRPLGDFSLVNHRGESVTDESLKGKPFAAFFFYTTCPGPCIVLNRSIEDAQPLLDSFPDLQFVGFSVDPEYDTPERLAEYSKNYNFRDGHWMYVTGDEEEIYNLVRNDFLLPVVETPEQMRESEGAITHSGKVALVNKNGFIVEFLDAMSDDFPTQLRDALLRHGM